MGKDDAAATRRLRAAMVAQVRHAATLTASTIRVLEQVPRHCFLPDRDASEAYALAALVTKWDADAITKKPVMPPSL